MVFKKGHKPFKKNSSPDSSDISDIYVKFGIKNDVKSNLSSLSYLVSELKKDLSIINNFRQKKALLRKDFYEVLISLRMNMDSMEKYLPSKEFEALKKKIDEINKFAAKQEKDDYSAPKKKEKIMPKAKEKPKTVKEIKREFFVKKSEPALKKKDELYDNASDAEKKELEMLKKDLEEINRQLRNVEE